MPLSFEFLIFLCSRDLLPNLSSLLFQRWSNTVNQNYYILHFEVIVAWLPFAGFPLGFLKIPQDIVESPKNRKSDDNHCCDLLLPCLIGADIIHMRGQYSLSEYGLGGHYSRGDIIHSDNVVVHVVGTRSRVNIIDGESICTSFVLYMV